MVASSENRTTAKTDSPERILGEAVREFAALEAKLAQLSDRVAGVIAGADQDRGSIQHFIDAFALEQEVRQPRPADADRPALFDFDHIQRERHDLEQLVLRSKSLRTTIESALQVVRVCKEQFVGSQAFEPPKEAEDVRLQQGMNAAREEERRRLAREIHDGPAQVLANAVFVIGIAEQVAKREPEKVSEQLGDLKVLLKDGIAEIRRFMFDLRPSMLEDQGLAPTLRYYVGEYNRMFAKRVELILRDTLPALTEEQELCVFRIVQEALQNIQKHAETDEARVVLEQEERPDGHERFLVLTVADRGRGFNPARTVPRTGQGAGLPGMRERARLIGADLTVTSNPGEGTTVRLLVPLRGGTGRLDYRDPAPTE